MHQSVVQVFGVLIELLFGIAMSGVVVLLEERSVGRNVVHRVVTRFKR